MSARLPDDPFVAPEIYSLREGDEDAARGAFERLWTAALPAVRKHLARLGLRGANAEDVAQVVAAELWGMRRGTRATSLGEWYSLARVITARLAAAHWASVRPHAPIESVDRLPDKDMAHLDAIVEAALQSDALYQGADRLWLGETADAADAEIGTAVLLVHLVGRVPRERAGAMFGAVEGDLDRWMTEPAVLARALFRALCWDGADLAGYVLRPERPLLPDELDRLAEIETAAWDPMEARAVLWRARHGMRDEQILRAAQGEIGEAALAGILRRYREALPFLPLASRLDEALQERGIGEALRSPGLWRRIAFEYDVHHALPHFQIVERAGPPADLVGVRVDAPTLNNWLSMGRLYAQLGTYLRKEAR